MHLLAVATALRLEHPAVGQQALLDLLEPHTLYYTHNAHNVKFEIEKNTEPRIRL